MFQRHHRDRSRAQYVRCAAVSGLLFLLIVTLPSETHPAGPSISLGKGRSKVVEYDRNFQPLRTWTGLDKPVDITPLADGTILLVDEGTRRVILLDANGQPRWNEQIGPGPMRARPRPGGGYLITSQDNTVIATRSDRTIEWTQPVQNVRTAVPLANGNILTASNDGNGWLTEMTPQGRVVWRSEHRSDRPDGDQNRGLYFASVWGLDVGADGTALAAVFDGSELRVIAPDRRRVRTIPGMAHTTDVRLGPGGELVATSPEAFRVWIERPDGRAETFAPPMRPVAANVSPAGTVLVGLTWEPERTAMRASEERARTARPVAWWRRGLPIPLLGAVAAFAIAFYFRRVQLRYFLSETPLPKSVRADQTGADGMPQRAGARVLAALLTVTLCAAIYVAWSGITALQPRWSAGAGWRFGLGCVVAGVALRLLNALAGSAGTLSSFIPACWLSPSGDSRRGPVGLLLVLSLLSIVVSGALVMWRPAAQAGAVALWLAAQILMLAAAFPPRPAALEERGPGWAKIAVGVILLGAIITRFWKIGYYPDFVHHDHSIYGDEVLKMLHGEWTPFFVRIYSVTRAAFLPVAAALQIFGAHHWVLRLFGAIAGVVIVWGTYLLGTALFNWRVGLFGALLTMANNVLLLYSRQPYVLDPVAPFVLALYCIAVGLRRVSGFHWCLAGFLGAWALLEYHASVTLPPIGAVWLLYLVLVYPRAMWRHRTGLLWLVGGFVVVYLPMLAQEIVRHEGLDRTDIIVFLRPDGSINWDPAVWAHQLGQAFGSIFFFAETNPWVVGTGQPICMQYGAVVAGIGLTYLLFTWRTPATFLLLAWTAISIFLGNATLPNPPTFYHTLAAIVPIMLAGGVAVDRVLALTDRARAWPWRVPMWLGATAVLALVSITNVQAVWLAVRRPAPKDGHELYVANARILAARFIREHPAYRYYLVRSAINVDATADNEIFHFFAADSDLSDISNDLTDALPVSPPKSGSGVAFLVLPTRAADREHISRVYPTATVEELWYAPGDERVWVYLVDAQAVRDAYEARRRAAPHSGDPTIAGIGDAS